MKAQHVGVVLLWSVLMTPGSLGADGADTARLKPCNPDTSLGSAGSFAWGAAGELGLLSTEAGRDMMLTPLHSGHSGLLSESPDAVTNVELSRWSVSDRFASLVPSESIRDESSGLLIEAQPLATVNAGDVPAERDRSETRHPRAATVGAGLLTGVVITLAYLRQRRFARRCALAAGPAQ